MMIVVQELSKSYGDVNALERVSFQVSAYSSLAILGPSGSGKTTLLRLIAGLEVPDSGQVFIDGMLCSQPDWMAPPHLRGIGFVFQTASLWPHMTVAQNILYGLQKFGKEAANQRLAELMENTGIQGLERRYPSQLSGGQARRVSIARALAPRPKILLMDEPLINVDPATKVRLLDLIKESVAGESSTLIYVTHDPEEAAHFSAPPMVLKDGRFEQ